MWGGRPPPRAIVLQQAPEDGGGGVERRPLLGLEAFDAVGQVGGLALALLLEQRAPRRRHGQQRGAAVLRISGAPHHPAPPKPRPPPRPRGPPPAPAPGRARGGQGP